MEIMSRAEACAYLGISRNTMTQLTNEHKIPFIQYVKGGAIKFDRDSLDRWIKTREVQPWYMTAETHRKRRTAT